MSTAGGTHDAGAPRGANAAAFVAAIIPLIAIWVAKVVVWARPFWIHFYDPETIYFYGGLDLLRGELPDNVDNPGTPLQMLSAAIIAFTGRTPARYEAFLSAAHVIELLLLLAGAAIVFYGILGGAGPLARITAVWLYFAAPQALERIDIWSPELLYLPLGAAMIALFRRWMVRPSPGLAAGIGALGGIGAAAKLAFLPFPAALVLTLLLARRIRHAAAAAAGILLGFVLATLPVATEYGSIARRLLFLSGSGHATQSWPELLMSARTWLLCLAVIAVVVTMCVRRSPSLLPFFCLLAFLLAAAASARNPSFRYLLPCAIAVVGLFASAAVSGHLTLKWQVLVLTLVAAVFGKAALQDVATHRQRIATHESTRKRIEALIPRNAVMIYGWRAPIPSFALRVSTEDARDLAEISRLHPREGHLGPWNRKLYLPEGAVTWDYGAVNEEDAVLMMKAGGQEVGRVDGFIVLRRRSP